LKIINWMKLQEVSMSDFDDSSCPEPSDLGWGNFSVYQTIDILSGCGYGVWPAGTG